MDLLRWDSVQNENKADKNRMYKVQRFFVLVTDKVSILFCQNLGFMTESNVSLTTCQKGLILKSEVLE